MLVVLLSVVASGCALLGGSNPPPTTRYTLAPSDTATPPAGEYPSGPRYTLDLRATRAPAWLDSREMLYRLDYADRARALSAYTRSRWAAPPAQLVNERLAETLAGAGLFDAVLADVPGRADLTLQIALADFSQHFASATQSAGQIAATATLLREDTGRVIAQKRFTDTAASPTADAAGGVAALNTANARLDRKIERWLAATLAGCGPACPAHPVDNASPDH